MTTKTDKLWDVAAIMADWARKELTDNEAIGQIKRKLK